jgi:hypothetical protein
VGIPTQRARASTNLRTPTTCTSSVMFHAVQGLEGNATPAA